MLAREVIALLDVFENEILESWYNYFTTGGSKFFYTMMERYNKLSLYIAIQLKGNLNLRNGGGSFVVGSYI